MRVMDVYETEEIEQDGDRLAAGLDRQAILAFAQHRALAAGEPVSGLVHVTAVGELAARYADAFYADRGEWLEGRYRRRVCESAGFLHEVMNQGCDFESVTGVADEAVARVVAAVTADCRVTLPRRLLLLANQVGLADVDAQIVKLADLRHTGRTLAGGPADDPRLRAWIAETTVLLGSFVRLKNTPLASRLGSLRAELHGLESSLRRSA